MGPFRPEGGERMNKYETMFIVNPELGEEVVKGIVEKFKTLIETSSTLETFNEWGRRKLAYPIDDINDGYYVLVDFSAAPEFPAELHRIYKITDGILRYMIVRKEK